MIVQTEQLRGAFKVIDQVESGSGLLSSQFVRIGANAHSLLMNLSGLVFSETKTPFTDGPAPAPWSFYADRRVLGGFISGAQTDTVELVNAKDAVTMKSGRQKIQLTPMGDISGYQQWKRAKDFKTVKLGPSVQRDLGMMAKYAPELAALDHLSAVQVIKGYGMLATDSMSLAAKLDDKLTGSMALPTGIARLIPALDCKEIVVESTGVGLVMENGYLYQTNSQKLLKEYPVATIKALIADGMKVPAALKLPRAEFAEALSYLDNFSGFGAGVGAAVTAVSVKRTLFLSLKLQSGVIEKRIILEKEPAAPLQDAWQLSLLAPWSKHIAEVASEDISFAKTANTGFHIFRSGKTFLLALASHA